MRIIDTGDGWRVVGDWYGQERTIMRPRCDVASPHSSFEALAACIDFVKEQA